LLACGSFLVIAVGANRQDPRAGVESRSSGTGGFAFWGETTLPLLHDLNTDEGCNFFGLSRADIARLDVVAMRLREGDEASCLNLNRAQKPKIIGVDPTELAGRGAFQFTDVLSGDASPESAWTLLNQSLEDGAVPAVADQATVMWALGKSLGDYIEYQDDHGKTVRLQLVGALSNSIFQGHLIIADKTFVERFSSVSGYRLLLMDAPAPRRTEYRDLLLNALQDIGLEITPTGERLAAFYAVENTYLSIFQILGGLGLILGCFGLGVVVMRNILERQAELALLKALGFSKGAVQWMVIMEHSFLLFLGLLCGVFAGFTAIAPAMQSRMEVLPIASLGILLCVMIASGLIWIFGATRMAARKDLINALRSE
ncbi:MAG: hypothetical protein JXR73_14235, partial [Candidatus Omnitrophica bacterium]|nr:hypothetical protein [Candidatus Omnitrophota bacterium]